MLDTNRLEEVTREDPIAYVTRFGFWPVVPNLTPGTVSIHQPFFSYDQLTRPGSYTVSFHTVPESTPNAFLPGGEWWGATFSVRDPMNPTLIGRDLGIRCRDKPLLLETPEGRAVDELLRNLAFAYARHIVGGDEFKVLVSPNPRGKRYSPIRDAFIAV